jgi:hypothetical protein
MFAPSKPNGVRGTMSSVMCSCSARSPLIITFVVAVNATRLRDLNGENLVHNTTLRKCQGKVRRAWISQAPHSAQRCLIIGTSIRINMSVRNHFFKRITHRFAARAIQRPSPALHRSSQRLEPLPTRKPPKRTPLRPKTVLPNS